MFIFLQYSVDNFADFEQNWILNSFLNRQRRMIPLIIILQGEPKTIKTPDQLGTQAFFGKNSKQKFNQLQAFRYRLLLCEFSILYVTDAITSYMFLWLYSTAKNLLYQKNVLCVKCTAIFQAVQNLAFPSKGFFNVSIKIKFGYNFVTEKNDNESYG